MENSNQITSTLWDSNFIMSVAEEKNEYTVSHKVFFRDEAWNLLGFFLFHYCKDRKIVCINDSTSSSSYNFLSQNFKKFYDENWYNPEFVNEKWSAYKMLKQLLDYIYEKFPEVHWVNFAEDQGEKNKQRLSTLIENTSKVSQRILDVRWWRECSWTVKIR